MSRYASAWGAWAVTAASWVHASTKAAARLLQSGSPEHGSGLGLLPLVTTPPELEFWMTMLGAVALSELERWAFNRLSARAERSDGKGGDGAEDGGGGGSGGGGSGSGGGSSATTPKSAAEAAADAAAEMKKQYVKRTEPKEVLVRAEPHARRSLQSPSAPRARVCTAEHSGAGHRARRRCARCTSCCG